MVAVLWNIFDHTAVQGDVVALQHHLSTLSLIILIRNSNHKAKVQLPQHSKCVTKGVIGNGVNVAEKGCMRIWLLATRTEKICFTLTSYYFLINQITHPYTDHCNKVGNGLNFILKLLGHLPLSKHGKIQTDWAILLRVKRYHQSQTSQCFMVW